MLKTSSAESILALIAGRPRAAAIFGDLTEMAATHGRLWFWTAYARTILSLTWRILLALFIADIGREFIFNLADFYFHVTPPTWRTTHGPYLLSHMGPLLACILSTLWFALPFAAVRYGLRDRFVQLTFAISVGTTLAFLFIPAVSLLFAGATLVLAASALGSEEWRRPLTVIAGTGASGILLVALAAVLQHRLTLNLASHIHPYGFDALLPYGNVLLFQSSLLLIALVCSRLHRRLLPATLPLT